jgi:hypothetical protein
LDNGEDQSTLCLRGERAMRKFVLGALVGAPATGVAVAAMATAVAASSATPVISGVSYRPKPVYDDDSVIQVTFRASRPARPGYEWGVSFVIVGKNVVVGTCSPAADSWDPVSGGNPRSHMRSAGVHDRILHAKLGGHYWCRGQVVLTVQERKIGSGQKVCTGCPGSTILFRIVAAP